MNIKALGSASTDCFVTPQRPMFIEKTGGVSAARKEVLGSSAAIVTCVRSDQKRNLSVRITAMVQSEGLPSAKKRATKVAGGVDRFWANLAGAVE